MVIFIPAAIIMLAGVIYLAVSKQSSFRIRIAALTALALMILTVIICLFLVFRANTAPEDSPMVFIPDAPLTPPKPDGNIMVLVGFVLFLIALFIAVLIISLREQRKRGPEAP